MNTERNIVTNLSAPTGEYLFSIHDSLLGRFVLKGRVMTLYIKYGCSGAVLAEVLSVLCKHYGESVYVQIPESKDPTGCIIVSADEVEEEA
jgi:hypothetical protein